MAGSARLSLGEFLIDIRAIITSPSQRFAVIHERGALWGSLVLLVVPAYLGFTFISGVYFDRDPFPGYSFVLPAAVAAAFQLLKLYFIHFFARLLQGGGRYSRGQGSYRDFLALFGYAGIPAVIAVLLALLLFALVPGQLGSLFREFHVLATSIMIALSVALFIWNLILMVLAMRRIYPMRDLKIVISLLIGWILSAVPVGALTLIAAPVRVKVEFVQPILGPQVLKFYVADPTSPTPAKAEIACHVDRLVYRAKSPGRSDLVAFEPSESGVTAERGKKERSVLRRWFMHEERRVIGRIVGLPGETVELTEGKLRIDGRAWAEPYLLPEYQSNYSVAPGTLGPSEYLVLPEDRRLVETQRNDLIIRRDRISGREIVNRWPLGWWLFRPTAFLRAHPADTSK